MECSPAVSLSTLAASLDIFDIRQPNSVFNVAKPGSDDTESFPFLDLNQLEVFS